jgi:hypothetical protein
LLNNLFDSQTYIDLFTYTHSGVLVQIIPQLTRKKVPKP